jgi:hypothetical protein
MKKYHKVKIEIKPKDYVHGKGHLEFDLFGVLGLDLDNPVLDELRHTSLDLEVKDLEAKSLPVFLITDELCLILLDPKDGLQRITDLGMISQEEALTHNNPDIREYGLKLAGKL